MTFVDESLTRRRALTQRMVGGGTYVGETFEVISDIPAGHSVGNGMAVVLQGSTNWQETFDAVLRKMSTLTVTIGTSEPIISGTNIPLYRVSALLDGGMTVREVMEDFPSLTEAQIANARNYARRYPNFGKPYPQKSLKRLLRNSGFAQLEQALRKVKKRS
jgi:uncharacterized protein (DUF433 family)